MANRRTQKAGKIFSFRRDKNNAVSERGEYSDEKIELLLNGMTKLTLWSIKIFSR